MKRTGILGGTFDPIHNGHLFLAETIRSDFPLDNVIFIPAAQPPHKDRIFAPPWIRYNMVKMAVDAIPYFEVSDIELKRNEKSYTIDTIETLYQIRKEIDEELYLIIGADSLIEVNSWKDPRKLFQMIKVIVINRSGFEINRVDEYFREKIHLVTTPLIEISSSVIRERIHAGKSIRYWVPQQVETFIFEEGLYQ